MCRRPNSSLETTIKTTNLNGHLVSPWHFKNDRKKEDGDDGENRNKNYDRTELRSNGTLERRQSKNSERKLDDGVRKRSLLVR